jgi:hypothetical protein
MPKILFTSSAALFALSLSLGLMTEAKAESRAHVCERVRQVCLGTGKSAEFCQANVEHCLGHTNHVGGLTGSTNGTKALRDMFWWGCAYHCSDPARGRTLAGHVTF